MTLLDLAHETVEDDEFAYSADAAAVWLILLVGLGCQSILYDGLRTKGEKAQGSVGAFRHR